MRTQQGRPEQYGRLSPHFELCPTNGVTLNVPAYAVVTYYTYTYLLTKATLYLATEPAPTAERGTRSDTRTPTYEEHISDTKPVLA